MVGQIRDRARRADRGTPELPDVTEERLRARVRAAFDLDDRRPYDVQKALHLEGTWNVTPQDLVESRRRGAGAGLAAVRRMSRPILKIFANFELPLYKQFKINLGIAEALHDQLSRTLELETKLDHVTSRLEALEASRRANGADD